MLREPPWSTAGGCGQRPGPPGPFRATGPAPACLAVWGGGLRWLPGCPAGSLEDGLSTWLGSMWPLPAAPWLPDPAPLGCARQIPSSWDLPAISLSKDGALGRGVCERTERVRHEAAYLGFCSCPLSGAGGGTARPPPSQTQPSRSCITEPGAGEACPKTGGRGPSWGPPCLAVCQLLSASHGRSPRPGRLQPTPEFGVCWAWFILASVPCSCVALDLGQVPQPP